MSALTSETRPQDCWDWLTPDDVLRFAMRAVEMARRDCIPPAGEPFVEDGVVWVGRDRFAEILSESFALQVKTRAYQLGIGGDTFEADAVQLAQFDSPVSTGRTEALR